MLRLLVLASLAIAARLALSLTAACRVPSPVLNVRLFRHNTVYALSTFAAFVNHATTFALTFLLSLYLQYIEGFEPHYAGLILLSQPAMMTIFSPLAGRLSDRIEPRIVSSVGFALSGLGFGLFSSPNLNAIMSSVDRTYYGVAAATTSSMRVIGQVISMAIATLAIAIFVGNVQITPEYHPAFQSAFRLACIVYAILCLVGVLASLARGRVHAHETPTGTSTLEQLPTRN